MLVGSWKGFSVARAQYGRLGELLEKIPADWLPLILNSKADPLVMAKAFVGGLEALDNVRPSRNRSTVSKLERVNFTAGPLEHKEEDIQEVKRDSPLYALLDPQKLEEEYLDLHFRLDKTVTSDHAVDVLEALRRGGWTVLEYRYAVDYLENCAGDEAMLKELQYANFITTLIFNKVRTKLQVQAGRLHNLTHARRIAGQLKQPIAYLFDPVRVAGESEIRYMLKPLRK